MDSFGSVLLFDCSCGEVVQRFDLPIAQGAFRSFNGLTFAEGKLFAARPISESEDEIVVMQRETFRQLASLPLPECSDVHQIDWYDGLLWITNTNRHEIVVVDPESGDVVGRRSLFPDVPEERRLRAASIPRPNGDHRLRPHINSLIVERECVQVGLFGTNQGDFQACQLLEVPWRRSRRGHVEFSCSRPLAVRGLRYPHNSHRRPDGRWLACSSATGELFINGRRISLGGWPRGVAISSRSLFVALSSYSYGLNTNEAAPLSNCEIVHIDRETLEIRERFDFGQPGQLYEVRLADEPDLGMSQFLTFDEGGVAIRRSAA